MSARLVEVRASRRERRCGSDVPLVECTGLIAAGETYVRVAVPPDDLVPYFRARTLCAAHGAHYALEAGKGAP